jgi:hypothetical protein
MHVELQNTISQTSLDDLEGNHVTGRFQKARTVHDALAASFA